MDVALAELARRYGAELPEEAVSVADELFPDKLALVVREEGRRRVLDVMAWGFPFRTRGRTKMIDKRVTNVRNLESPFWRSALTTPTRRCLVPFTTFSEYGPDRGTDGKLQPYWFDVPSRPIASFAGVWQSLGHGGRAFAFLTCEPNSLVAPIHAKAMPVVLDDEGEERWLRGELEGMAEPFPAQLMRVRDG